jgi:hypothetical protein
MLTCVPCIFVVFICSSWSEDARLLSFRWHIEPKEPSFVTQTDNIRSFSHLHLSLKSATQSSIKRKNLRNQYEHKVVSWKGGSAKVF